MAERRVECCGCWVLALHTSLPVGRDACCSVSSTPAIALNTGRCDGCRVAILHPGNKKTHRAYLWAYAPEAFEDLKVVVYDLQ